MDGGAWRDKDGTWEVLDAASRFWRSARCSTGTCLTRRFTIKSEGCLNGEQEMEGKQRGKVLLVTTSWLRSAV